MAPPTVLWIGLGNMGRGMCTNMAEKGKLTPPLLLFNRTHSVATDLAARLPAGKARAVASIKEGMSSADIIFLCLSADIVVLSTLHSIIADPVAVSSKLVIDTSTVHPSTAAHSAQLVTSVGGQFLSAPVFGAPAMAEAGQLIVVPAGPAEAVERAKPFFNGVIARAVIDMSEQPHGMALALKVIGNTFIFNMVEQLAEGHVLAEKTGLDAKYLHHFVELFFGQAAAAYSNRMLSGDYYKREHPLMPVDLARKDLGHAMNLAKEAGTRLQNAETADAHLEKLKEHVGARGDAAGIYGVVRMEAGLPFERGEETEMGA